MVYFLPKLNLMKKLLINTTDCGTRSLDVDGLLLDSDGTLIRSEHVLNEARDTALRERGFAVAPHHLLQGHTFPNAMAIIEGHQSEGDRSRLVAERDTIAAQYRAICYQALEGCIPGVEIFPDVLGAIRAGFFEAVRTCIVTNAPEPWYAAILRNPTLAPFYAERPAVMPEIEGQRVGRPKPAPDLCVRARTDLDLRAPVMIGDSPLDREAALAANMPVIIVQREDGHGSSSQLEQACYVVRGFQDLSFVR